MSKIFSIACTVAVAAPSFARADECLKISLYGLREFEASPANAPPRTTFKLNEPFVLCIELDANRFVTVWDAPPAGNEVERLFPNRLTHKDQTVIAVELPAARHCYGTQTPFASDAQFPLVQDEGPGKGAITAVASASLKDQPTLDDYTIPGRQLKSAAKSKLFNTGASKSCDAKQVALVRYDVVK